MSRLKKQIKDRREIQIPEYSLTKKRRQIKLPTWLMVTLSVNIILAAAIYMPPLLMPDDDVYYRASTNTMTDESAMEKAIAYLRNNPEADFDGDGLVNEDEKQHNSGVFVVDNDNDGTTDYAELYITETNPTVPDDAIIRYMMEEDSKIGSTVNTPIKVNDVVMWADDYESKARGSVVALAGGGYRFFNFKGWVQFPGDPYVYELDNGVHKALEENASGYYYIERSPTTVMTYTQELIMLYELHFFGGDPIYLEDDFIGQALSFILPNKQKGSITCRPVAMIDTDGTMDEEAYINAPFAYEAPALDDSRFARNDIKLEKFAEMRNMIDKGYCALVSLMSHSAGESVVMVYGYTNRDNLMVCDPASGEKLGVINVTVKSERMLDHTGTIQQYESFDFSGCGFSSASRHRISILGYVAQGGDFIDAAQASMPVVETDDGSAEDGANQ